MSTDYKGKIMYSMTQAKFNELREANGGKLPAEYANSYVYTDAEDVNLSQMRTEIVYDMSSSDANKNWNYTGGIAKGRTVSGKDFTKYKSLIVYMGDASNPNDYQVNVIIKIDGVANTGSYGSSVVGWNNANYMIFVNSQKTSITNNSDYNSIITKIEGVLKSPAMMYTGAELHQGNGIKINNGVISSEHPIGSYHICKTGSENPAALFGGKWEQVITNAPLPFGQYAGVGAFTNNFITLSSQLDGQGLTWTGQISSGREVIIRNNNDMKSYVYTDLTRSEKGFLAVDVWWRYE